MKEAGAAAVKLEGGQRVLDAVARMTAAGIPVTGHLVTIATVPLF